MYEKGIQLTLVVSTSLISNNRLSRSEKSGPCTKYENLTTGKKNIVEKRRNCSISPLFYNIFNISLTSYYIYLLNVVVRMICSSILQIWYVEVRISRSISESPLEFEITRVDCTSVFVIGHILKIQLSISRGLAKVFFHLIDKTIKVSQKYLCLLLKNFTADFPLPVCTKYQQTFIECR